MTRDELLASYDHPYRRWLPLAWRLNHVDRTVPAVVVAVAIGTLLMVAVDDEGLPAVVMAAAVLAAVAALVHALWVTVVAAEFIWRRTRTWRDDGSELGRVRAQRPHAGEADPQVAHDEYAIAVGEGGRLVMWRFTPLAADQTLRDEHTPIHGLPRYGATPVDETPFDGRDVALAAEQLAAAQQNAAVREAAAVETARTRLAQRDEFTELATETESTGEALRLITGQDRRKRDV